MTRGVIVDLPRMKNVPYLEAGTPVYPTDLEAWEKYAGITTINAETAEHAENHRRSRPLERRARKARRESSSSVVSGFSRTARSWARVNISPLVDLRSIESRAWKWFNGERRLLTVIGALALLPLGVAGQEQSAPTAGRYQVATSYRDAGNWGSLPSSIRRQVRL